jgi:site-specific recombinase XerD
VSIARRNTTPLTPFATEFLLVTPAARVVVRQFDVWLKASCRPIRQLDEAELEQFLQRLARRPVADRTRTQQRALALKYFDWLHARDLLRIDPRCAWPRSNFPLPPLAQRFLDLLKPTHGASTVATYQTNLRQFHIWLRANGTSLDSVSRSHVESWLQWLQGRDLAACTRVHAIQNVRAYLEWLEEERVLSAPAVELVRGTDLPKLPKYLPRPVPPDIDAELQRRFKSSGCIYQRGLLLMRRTGLRIGELMMLPYRCVRADHAGNVFLKVPLGKLATERLVPLDPKTAKLVSRLRREGPRKRSLLLVSSSGERTRYEFYRQALATACRGLTFAEPMTTHRLRHTYATSLLGAGMSLPSVMRLLGHTDYRMTLRYAAITDSTVVSEFTAAMAHSAERYPTLTKPPAAAPSLDPLKVIPDIVRCLYSRTADQGLDRRTARAIAQRLRRLHADLRRFLRTPAPHHA